MLSISVENIDNDWIAIAKNINQTKIWIDKVQSYGGNISQAISLGCVAIAALSGWMFRIQKVQ